MAVEVVLDVTSDIAADGRCTVDVGGFDYFIVQLVAPNATANFQNTNDSGDVLGVSEGSAASATNFATLQGTDLSTGSGVTSVAAGASSTLVRFSYAGRYFRITGAGLNPTKTLIRLFKIN